MAHILIIEDDPKIGPMLLKSLEFAGYRASLAADGRSGLRQALQGNAQLIVLDLMLPHVDGLHILKRMRGEMINTPVIILTAKGTEAERLEGFRAGCDDYVTKPFSVMELVARIRAVLRRIGWREVPSVINCKGFTIDPGERSVRIDGKPVVLSAGEFELLYTLASRPDQALSRNHLLDEVWGEETDVTHRAVDARILSLRRKIEKDPESPQHIITVYKVGYKWNTVAQASLPV